MEVRKLGPDTRLVDAKDGKVLGLDLVDIWLVRNSEGTTFEVVEAQCMHRAAGEVIPRARVVVLTNVRMALRRVPPRRETLVTRELGCDRLSCRKFEDVALVRRIIQMSVEPPLFEGVVHKRRHRAIVVRERLHRDVEPIHARMPYGCQGTGQASGSGMKLFPDKTHRCVRARRFRRKTKPAVFLQAKAASLAPRETIGE